MHTRRRCIRVLLLPLGETLFHDAFSFSCHDLRAVSPRVCLASPCSLGLARSVVTHMAHYVIDTLLLCRRRLCAHVL